LESGYLLFNPDEKRGKALEDEILKGGNFGKFDDDYRGIEDPAGERWKYRLLHYQRIMRYYPQEVLADIPFRIRRNTTLLKMRRFAKKYIANLKK